MVGLIQSVYQTGSYATAFQCVRVFGHYEDDFPEMPKPLASLVMQMLAKDPADRPIDMRAIRDALKQIAAPVLS